MMLRKIGITRRLALIFSLLGILTVLVGAIAVFHFEETEDNLDNIVDRRMPATRLTSELTRDFLLIRLYTVNILYANSEVENRQNTERLTSTMQQFQDTNLKVAQFHQTAKGQEVYNRMVQAKQQYDVLHQQLLALMKNNQKAEAERFRQQGFNEASTKVTEALSALAAYQENTANNQATEAREGISLAIMQMLLTIIAVLVGATIFALLFSRSLLQPLKQAGEISQRIASGDLRQDFADQEPDEMGALIRAMGQMQLQLKQTLGEINASSAQLATTSEELSVVTEQSSRTLHQQSQELEMAATAVTELTTAVEEVARNAADTSRNSELADSRAKQGHQQVSDTIKTVKMLEQDLQLSRQSIEKLALSVKDISTVLDVIRAIAEQTNLLALNAAIEAARAGDSGRGFAVVADEVRALAHRTQDSTKEIEKMMQTIQSESQNTVTLMQTSSNRATETVTIAQQAGEALQQIASAISQISDQNMTIASAAEEQATVAREVDLNLVNIRDLSVQTSAGANETQASSNELARLAETMNQLVTQFKI